MLEWDEATLNRFEQGALQETSEDKWLKFIMSPQNLLYLITDVTQSDSIRA